MISLIVAHDKNRVIGNQNALPWHLPGDLKYFKEMTLHKPVIMGRKTFESIGKPLKDRINIVVTRQNRKPFENGVMYANTIHEALFVTRHFKEVMIIGGAQIYEQAMQYANRLYVTQIDHEFEGDAYFPSYDDWQLVSENESISAGEYSFRYCVYERVK